jgi:hypothetical protein
MIEIKQIKEHDFAVLSNNFIGKAIVFSDKIHGICADFYFKNKSLQQARRARIFTRRYKIAGNVGRVKIFDYEDVIDFSSFQEAADSLKNFTVDKFHQELICDVDFLNESRNVDDFCGRLLANSKLFYEKVLDYSTEKTNKFAEDAANEICGSSPNEFDFAISYDDTLNMERDERADK